MQFSLWIPSLFDSKGGIQVYSAYFLKALQQLSPKATFRIFLKHDRNRISSTILTDQLQFSTAGEAPASLRTLAFTAKLAGWSLWQRPDLIISTHLNFITAAWLLQKLTRTPYWVIAHGIEAWSIQDPFLQAALKKADRILAVSHYTRDRLIQQAIDPAKVIVLPNTFDSNRFVIGPKPAHLLQRYGLAPEQPVILTVARLETTEKYKGYDKILAALPQIRQTVPNVHYVLVGKGGDRDRIEQLIEQYQIQDCVTLTGYVPDEALTDHYNLCDVFAMPSKKEGFGIVYLEAMACGKPTLGGNQDGTVDALCHGELGALVNPDSVEEVAQTLIQILQGTYANPLMYQAQRLRQKVIDTFGFEQFQQTLGYYLDQFLEDGRFKE
jgi:glycosyltransferase involved in cell wall biosynthesis